MANPTLLSRLLCADADKNTIPDTDAGTAGIFSQQYGWQAINSLPLSAGGKAVQRQDFNGVFNLLGGIAFYAQKGYTFGWDIGQDYYAGCVVIDSTDGKRYECIADVTANVTPPSADTTHWKEYGADLTVLANTDLSNLTATGEAKFTGRADTSLSNLTQTGEDHFLSNDFTIIYPHGGTEANPATVSASTRYVENNPFTGYYVNCIVEVYLSNEWTAIRGSVTYGTGTTGGIMAGQLGDTDNIIIKCGSQLNYAQDDTLLPNGVSTQTPPCRVKVWKIGKIPT